jgi:ABC-type nitrate/sulfonate/bicarbonate transport system permease component
MTATISAPPPAVDRAPASKKRPSSKRVRRLLRRSVVPTVLLAAWLTVTQAKLIDPLFVPSPQDLWLAFTGLSSQLPGALAASVSMTLGGFAIGVLIGVGSGLLMAYSPVARDLLSDLMDIMRPVPVFALIPLFALWFGIGIMPQITLIALGTSMIMGVTTLDAIRNVSPVHIKAALTLGANRGQVYRTVIIPSISPHLLGSIRVAAAASWGLDVAAEFLGAQQGLGYTMIVRQQYLDTAGIVLICIIYSVLALVLDYVIRKAEAPLTAWTERSSKSGPVAGLVGNA